MPDDFQLASPSEGLDEEKAVRALATEYKNARDFDEGARDQYAADRAYASGAAFKNWASNTNLVGTFIDILASFLYARDPDVTALAAQKVGGVDRDSQLFAETASLVVSRLWKKGRLKPSARKAVRSALTVGVGWLKIVMTHDVQRDPIVQGKLNDLQDNIQRLQLLQLELGEASELDEDEISVKLQEFERQQEALQNQLEVAHRFGLAIDFVRADDMQVSLDIADTTEHLEADWNSDQIFVPTDELRAKFPRLSAEDVRRAAIYHQQKPKKHVHGDHYSAIPDSHPEDGKARYTKSSSMGTGDEVTFARVVELWDKRDNHIKTLVEGVSKWAVEPYQPNYATSRFYPYFQVALFETDSARHPQSLSGRLKKLQEEYASKRSNSRLAAERSVPGVIFDKQGISPEDARRIEQGVSQELIGIAPTRGEPLRQMFAEKPVAKIDPLIFDTGSALRDMERVSGVQEALTAAVSVRKTATEAKIQDTGFASRTSADRDTVEDMLRDLAEYTTEAAIQVLPLDFVQRVAGPLAFWPAGMDPDDVVTLAELDIKAGSTGKPDQEALRQAWAVILPIAQNTMAAIQQAQLTGNMPMAEALRNLLKETMRRLDERIDAEQFIPQGLPDLAGVQVPPGLEPEGSAPVETPPQTAADANTLV